MNSERVCLKCKHINKAGNEYPCVSCVHNAKDRFEKAKTIKVSSLIEQLQKIHNQEMELPLHLEIGKLNIIHD